MGSVVNAGEVLEVKVSIDLGGRDVGVAEELLHAAQLATRLEQVRGERMAEEVRMHRYAESLASRPVSDPALHRALAEALSVPADEERRLPGTRKLHSLGEPTLHCLGRETSYGNDACLAALAEHPHQAVLE